MLIPKENKIMVLFLSPENPWWGKISGKGRKVTAKDIREIADVPGGSFHNWSRGRKIDRKSGDRVFERVLKHIKDNVKAPGAAAELTEKVIQLSGAYYSKEPHMYDVAALMGIDISRSQQLIDETIYSRLPLFSSMYEEATSAGRGRIESRFDEIKGTYQLWMRRGSLWLECGLRVRYVLEIRDGLAIRCKLNVPVIDPEPDVPPYWEYDGFVSIRSQKAFWSFEKRIFNKGDFIHFITDLGNVHHGRLTMTGSYLTTGQDHHQSIVSNEVLLRRIAVNDVEKMEKAMHSSARVAPASEAAEIEQLWNASRGF